MVKDVICPGTPRIGRQQAWEDRSPTTAGGLITLARDPKQVFLFDLQLRFKSYPSIKFKCFERDAVRNQ